MAKITCDFNFLNRDWRNETVTITFNVNVKNVWLQKKLTKYMFHKGLKIAYNTYNKCSMDGMFNHIVMPTQFKFTHSYVDKTNVIEHCFNKINEYGDQEYIFTIKLIM